MNPSTASKTWIVLVHCLFLAPCAALAQPSIAEIEKAWKQRQERLASGHVEWVEHDRHPKGSMTRLVAHLRGQNAEAVPSEDVMNESRANLTWDGNQLAYRSEGWTLNIPSGRYVPMMNHEVLTSTGTRSLWSSTTNDFPFGGDSSRPTLPSANSLRLLPIVFWARPLDETNGGAPLRLCRPVPGKTTVGGAECLVLKQASGEVEHTWAIDEKRDYLIIQYECRKKTRPMTRVEIQYGESPRIGWAPSSWRLLFLPDLESVSIDCEGKLTRYEAGPPPNPASFQLDFPVGSWVRDETRDLQYIVGADDTQRIVTPGELQRGVTYRELVNTESGLAGTRSSSPWTTWVLLVATACLAVSIGAILAGRFAKHRHTG